MTENTNIKVVVRVRPYSRHELERSQRSVVHVVDKRTLLFDPNEDQDDFFVHGIKQTHRDVTKRINKNSSMEFDRVFDINTTNEDIFQECTAPLIDGLLNGYNCSVFVYGATGSGKTFTMLGSQNMQGLTYITMSYLFKKMKEVQDTHLFDVAVSYLEVYNEQVVNLLSKSAPLKLREDNCGDVVVTGLQLKLIKNADELIELLINGNSQRTQHPTDANAESSRSHAIFQVHIRITDKATGCKRTVKLSMIDLAGSERAASTKGRGERFKEGACINKSLLALGNCINKLADGLKHIPYRDSNLTRILKDSLGGNCQTLMIANVSMSSLNYDDTYNTLKYASRAKKIRSCLKQNVLKNLMPREYYIRKLNEVSDELKKLKENPVKPVAVVDDEIIEWRNKIDQFYEQYTALQNENISIKKDIKMGYLHDKLESNDQEIKSILDTGSRSNCVPKKEKSVRLHEEKKKVQSGRLKIIDAHLEVLKNEFESIKGDISKMNNNSELLLYLKNKELSRKHEKLKNTVKHLTSITHAMAMSSEKMSTAFQFACELLHAERNRFVDNSNFKELQKLIEVSHPDSNSNNDSTIASKTVGSYFPQSPYRNAKKTKLEDDSDDDTTSTLANKIRIVESTISNNSFVIEPSTSKGAEKPSVCNINNMTICVSPIREGTTNSRVSFSETSDDQNQMDMALLKAGKRIQGLPKENKPRSANRISKCPRLRRILVKYAPTAPTQVGCQRNQVGSIPQEGSLPFVRSNRASALRRRNNL